MLLQKVPGPEGRDPDGGDPDAWNRAVTLGGTVTGRELLTLPARQVIRRLFHQEDVRVFEARILSFRCSCSRERVVNMLRLLGHAEVRSIVAERGAVDVNCEFCNKHYALDAVDAEQIFAAEVVTPVATTRH